MATLALLLLSGCFLQNDDDEDGDEETGVEVVVSPASRNVQVGTTAQFTATVTNATNTAVTWTVSGTGCTGAACGTISASGLYTAPATVPSPASVLVTATSVEDNTRLDYATVTIVMSAPVNMLAMLNGTYVLNTFDQERNGFVTGTLSFDGAGHVTGGTVELNVPEVSSATQTTITAAGSSYTIGSTGRGRLTLAVAGVGTVHFSFVVVNSSLARVMYYEPTSTGDLFGTLEKQTSVATPSGKFVFRLEGTGLTGRRGYVGLIDLAANTAELDFTEPVPSGFANGYGTSHVPTATVARGTADSKGRGTLSIASTETGTLLLAYWVISATKIAIIPLDPVAPIINHISGAKPASGGWAEKQSTVTAGNLAAGSYVFTAMGFDGAGTFDRGGRIVSTGAATSAAVSDEVGATSGQHLAVATTCSTAVAATGRSDIYCSSGGWGLRSYFLDASHAYVLTYMTSNLGVGELFKQSAATYAGADIAGNFSLLAFGDQNASNTTAALAVAAGGTVSGAQDIAEDGSLEGDLAISAGSYTLNANGSGTTSITAGGITSQHSFWVASPSRIIGFTINDSDRESLILERQDLVP